LTGVLFSLDLSFGFIGMQFVVNVRVVRGCASGRSPKFLVQLGKSGWLAIGCFVIVAYTVCQRLSDT
jgi:hypothetical protein